jgi:4-hydroxy-tetrahydrodipicolinate reductase
MIRRGNMDSIKVVQVGLGPLGQKIVQYISERKGIKIIGAVELDPMKVGKDLGDLCSVDKQLDVKVTDDIGKVLKICKPDVAILSTVSSIKKLLPQLEDMAKLGINVVSTCEELSYPWKTEPEIAERINQTAKKHGVAVLGTGVNPGFLMDFFPIALTAVCQRVDSIKISRIQDATYRRIPFQKKIGAGLTLDEFERRKREGSLRHVGLTESMYMIAERMGWKVDSIEDIISPVIAEKEVMMGRTIVLPGMTLGVQQMGRAYGEGKERITLEFRASVGEPGPADTIQIRGLPDIVSSIPGGINGDVATCAIIINAMRSILEASPGLKTMTDIPVASYFSAWR